MNFQMMRVISSPSISTTGVFTLILAAMTVLGSILGGGPGRPTPSRVRAGVCKCGRTIAPGRGGSKGGPVPMGCSVAWDGLEYAAYHSREGLPDDRLDHSRHRRP